MLMSAIRRWRARRRERRVERLESKMTARETLRDYKSSTSDKGSIF